MMDKNAFWLLTAKYLAGEINESEKAFLLEWLQSDPLLQAEFEETKRLWQQTPADEHAYDDNLLQRTHQKISEYEAGQLQTHELPHEYTVSTPVHTLPERGKTIRRKWMAVAAAIIGFSLVSLWFFQANKSGNVTMQWASLDVLPGERHKIVLADSSIVYVNAGSHIEYPLAFIDSIREVRVQGEAFFDIAPNASQPFVVNSGVLRTRVLGTSFNVRAYKNEATQTVLVATGKVQVYAKDKALDVLLPDRMLTYQVQQQTAQVTHQLYGERDWMQNRMAFNDISFKDLAAELGRRYRKVFVFETPALENCRFRALFNNLPVEKIVQQLKFTNEFNYTVQGDSIYLKGKGCK